MTLKCNNLDGKVVLVTGGSSGIGRATCEAFAAQGARVAIHAFRGLERARAVEEQIRQAGGSAEVFCADLSRGPEIDRLVPEQSERDAEERGDSKTRHKNAERLDQGMEQLRVGIDKRIPELAQNVRDRRKEHRVCETACNLPSGKETDQSHRDDQAPLQPCTGHHEAESNGGDLSILKIQNAEKA
jgi:nucleoside-diphosphate-sugar epimerase